MSKKHAKPQRKTISVMHVAITLAVLVVGGVSAKSLNTPAEQSSDTVMVSEQVSNDGCSQGVVSGYRCRLDAQIDAATR